MYEMFVIDSVDLWVKNIGIEDGGEIREIWRLLLFRGGSIMASNLEIVFIKWQLRNLVTIRERIAMSWDNR